MATNRDKSVCFVIRANEMATNGGNKHSIPNFVSIRKSPPVFVTVVYHGNEETGNSVVLLLLMALSDQCFMMFFLLSTPSLLM